MQNNQNMRLVRSVHLNEDKLFTRKRRVLITLLQRA
jgi:hypothetical protein